AVLLRRQTRPPLGVGLLGEVGPLIGHGRNLPPTDGGRRRRYSLRRLVIGSTRPARRAGRTLAASAAAASSAADGTYESGAHGEIPKSRGVASRAAADAAARPSTRPATARRPVFESTSRRTLPAEAPSARRIPNSRVRRCVA